MEPMEKHEGVLDDVREFFNQKVKKFGPTHQAADYNSRESQEIRFDQLLKIVNTRSKFSLIDYGCGYGELIHYIQKLGYDCSYLGFDISEEMVASAKERMLEGFDRKFTTKFSEIKPADYTIACAIFNMKFKADDQAWDSFIKDS
jgi:SAM-dependent methyltransferase